MVPKINNRGHSFKGVAAYLSHDKESTTAERVVWSETGNLHTQDIEKAAIVMAWTDRNAELLKQSVGGSMAGRKPEAGGVYHYSLSWSPDEQPEREHMEAQAKETLQRLGLEDHQYFMVAHNDTDHTHLHVVANLTHPQNGQRLTPSFDKRELQAWALEYEQEHGIHCQMREENALKRERGEHTKYRDTKQDYSEKVTRAFYAADSGKAFSHSLEAEGLHLAQGRRGGFVIVDETGDIQKLGRQLEIEARGKEKTAAIKVLLGDVQAKDLQDAETLSKQIKFANQERRQEAIKTQERESKELDQEKETQKIPVTPVFNEAAKGETVETSRNIHRRNTTAEIVTQYMELAHNPLQNLRGWLDETGRDRGTSGLSAGQAGSQLDDKALRQVRAERPSGGTKSRASGATSEKITDSGQDHKRDNDRKSQLEAATLQEKIKKLEIPRYVSLKKIKAENAELSVAQSREKTLLTTRLKIAENAKTRAHRAEYEPILIRTQGEYREVEERLNKKGFYGAYIRLVHGTRLQGEKEALQKNIDNLQMRLNEGVGNLSRSDKACLAALGKTHKEQRDKLHQEHQEELQAIATTKSEKVQALLHPATPPPKLDERLQNIIDKRREQINAHLAKIEIIECEYNSPDNTPDNGKHEHETLPEQSQPERGGWFSNQGEDQTQDGWFNHNDNEPSQAMQELQDEYRERGAALDNSGDDMPVEQREIERTALETEYQEIQWRLLEEERQRMHEQDYDGYER